MNKQMKINKSSQKNPGFGRLFLNASKVKHQKINGIDYTTAPATLIVSDSVLCGQAGCFYYPTKVVGDSAKAWNNIPVTNSHPIENGVHVSAIANETISKKYIIGKLQNSLFRNGNLEAEVFLQDTCCPEIIQKLNEGTPVEISTGHFSDDTPITGNNEIIGNVDKIYPDHLAVLLNEIGACSIADGCGIRANQNRNDNEGDPEPLPSPYNDWSNNPPQNPGNPQPPGNNDNDAPAPLPSPWQTYSI